MKNRFCLFLLLSLFLLAGCHKKEVTKASQHSQEIKQSSEAVEVDSKKPFDFSILDTTNYYIGEVDNDSYIFKIDKTYKKGIRGRYYVVSSNAEEAAHRFEIEYKDDEYLFCTNSKDIPIKFDVSIDTASIIGSFSTSIAGIDEKSLTFEKYQAPKFVAYEATRYKDCTDDSKLDYEVKENVVYGNARGYWSSNPVKDEKYGKIIARGIAKTMVEKNVDLTMDVYLPKDKIAKRPLIVFLHGGAFYVGDKGAETMATWCKHFAEIGYVVASINYRMGFNLSKQSIQKCGYEAIQDAHAAIRYLVEHADDYGIDPDYIFVGGTSAGSITALGMTFMTNATRPPFVFENKFDKKLGNIECSSNKCKAKFKVRALANMWGAVYDLDELNGHHIPVISFHGTEDNLVPFDEGYPFSDMKGKLGEKLFDKMYGSKAIHERLDSLHIHNEFYPIEGVKHAPYQDKGGHPNSTYYFIQSKMENFFYQELAKIGNITKDKSNPQAYSLSQKDIKEICWKAEGGFILKSDGNHVVVLWRKDAKKKSLNASGIRENGCAFEQSKNF